MNAELKQAILKLKDRISDSEGYEEGLNEGSWNRQVGILITRNEANLIVGELEKPLPTDEQIREMSNEYARKHNEPKAGYVLNRRFGFQNGAIWMRDLIRDKSSQVSHDSNVTSKTYTPADIQAFFSWATDNGWSYGELTELWYNDEEDLEGLITDDVLKIWEEHK